MREHHHEHCSCGHEHHHSHAEQRVYILENLGCANCAAKMEKQIRELPGVEEASITFATKQLRVTAEHADELLPKFQAICQSVESEVKVMPQEEKKKAGIERERLGLL